MLFRRSLLVRAAVATGLVGVAFSDRVLDSGLSVALRWRERSLSADDVRLELNGLHTCRLSSQPSITVDRIRVSVPGFSKLALDGLTVRFDSPDQLRRFLFPRDERADRTIGLVSAARCEIEMTQNVMVSVVASAPAASLSAGGALVSSVFGAVVGTEKAAENAVSITRIALDDVIVRTFAGTVELPTTLRTRGLEIKSMQPKIDNLPFLLVDFVSIVVRTVVSSSAASVDTLLSLTGLRK